MKNERDELAQVGIGAMIVFIGALLAVTSSAYVMIQGLEKIGQTTQETVSVATKEAHTQIIFVGGWVDDHFDDYLFMIEYQSLGTEVVTSEIGYVLWCELNDNIYRRYGYLGEPLASAPDDVTIWAVGDDYADGIPETLESGKRYFVIADGGRGGGKRARDPRTRLRQPDQKALRSGASEPRVGALVPRRAREEGRGAGAHLPL